MKLVKFEDNSAKFRTATEGAHRMAAARIAATVERSAKTITGTPVDTGAMKADLHHYRIGKYKHRVIGEREYTAVQEIGRRMTGPGAPTRPFSNYTTPGTGKGWFRRAADIGEATAGDELETSAKAHGL